MPLSVWRLSHPFPPSQPSLFPRRVQHYKAEFNKRYTDVSQHEFRRAVFEKVSALGSKKPHRTTVLEETLRPLSVLFLLVLLMHARCSGVCIRCVCVSVCVSHGAHEDGSRGFMVRTLSESPDRFLSDFLSLPFLCAFKCAL